MATLVIGPSSVGKSTFIESLEFERLGFVKKDIVFGFQVLEKGLNGSSLIHYNMLHHIFDYSSDYHSANLKWNFLDEPIFNTIMTSGLVDTCVVMVAPISELLDRIERRTHIEQHMSPEMRYNRDIWSNAVRQLDIFRLYSQLFVILHRAGINPRVIYSSTRRDARFQESDEVFVHANLYGQFIDCPSIESVKQVLESPACQYQSVKLPYGFVTARRGYDHLGDDRSHTFDAVLCGNLQGASILDIGTALGDLLFNAERLGATTLVGIEPKDDRYSAAIEISKLLRSKAKVHHCRFLDFAVEPGSFDHVYALNVIHHVQDYYGFLVGAARAASKTLTLEFPTLTDERYRSVYNLDRETMSQLNSLPLIGLSSRSVDQTYVFSPAAVKKTVIDDIGGYSNCTILPSPIDDRVIMRFER